MREMEKKSCRPRNEMIERPIRIRKAKYAIRAGLKYKSVTNEQSRWASKINIFEQYRAGMKPSLYMQTFHCPCIFRSKKQSRDRSMTKRSYHTFSNLPAAAIRSYQKASQSPH